MNRRQVFPSYRIAVTEMLWLLFARAGTSEIVIIAAALAEMVVVVVVVVVVTTPSSGDF